LNTLVDSIKMFIKEVLITTSENEVELQDIAAKYGFSPEIIDITNTDKSCFIHMKDIDALCLADVYGEDPDDIPNWIWGQIRIMVKTLLDEEGIEYSDITPYNFIEKDNRIYMIDFGDAIYINKNQSISWFVQEFIDGENFWNPDYK